MKQPWLIQRCEVVGKKLRYDYMGSAEFENGVRAKALNRILAAGVVVSSVHITIGGSKIPVYMVAGKGFPFASYQQYLQQFAQNNSTLVLKECSDFDNAVKQAAGQPLRLRWQASTNAWFDIENDVLWTLNKVNQGNIVSVLQGIQKKKQQPT